MFGSFHAAEPLATNASVSSTTGVRCSSAIFAAAYTASKQFVGLVAAITGMGDSPLRPKRACNRSVCSLFVGRPVDGPPRCTSMTTSGSSSITARFMASDLRQMPGPDVEVAANAPANDAPMALAHPEISSSHCTVITPSDLCLASSCRMSVAGVMGYEPRYSFIPAFSAAAMSPYAVALLPVMSM